MSKPRTEIESIAQDIALEAERIEATTICAVGDFTIKRETFLSLLRALDRAGIEHFRVEGQDAETTDGA